MKRLNRILHSKTGQGITELALILPLLLLLSLGVIEVANMINSYLTLTHLTREGANMASRGETVESGTDDYGNPGSAGYDVLDAIVDSAGPVIRGASPHNKPQWLIIYSLITDPTSTNNYSVETTFTRGSLTGQTSKVDTEVINNMGDVAPGQTFHVVEVYYQYAPPGSCSAPLNCPLTPLQNFAGTFFGPMTLPTMFYDRSIFTDVS